MFHGNECSPIIARSAHVVNRVRSVFVKPVIRRLRAGRAAGDWVTTDDTTPVISLRPLNVVVVGGRVGNSCSSWWPPPSAVRWPTDRRTDGAANSRNCRRVALLPSLYFRSVSGPWHARQMQSTRGQTRRSRSSTSVTSPHTHVCNCACSVYVFVCLSLFNLCCI